MTEHEAVPLWMATDASRYGGKAAALARAIERGLPVPGGFALDYETVRHVRVFADLAPRKALAATIAARMPAELAVRSSAVGEDGLDASFAGQHHTCLNVKGVEQLLTAFAEVEASGHMQSVQAYRRRMGLPNEVRMGIVVQRFVPADIAGVMFTCNPATGTTNGTFVIEAARGLGDAIAQGLTLGDTAHITSEGLAISNEVGKQTTDVRPDPRGGVTERTVVAHDEPLLSAMNLIDLATLGRKCQALFGEALDIEWAMHDCALHLLQVRSAKPLFSR
jgi:pyruvate,water dikinase